MLSNALTAGGEIEVAGTAADPYEAKDKILQLKPDVITLDVEMPKMNGIEFLKKLLPQYPVPVIVITSTPTNAFEAISAGAVEFLNKPSKANMTEFAEDLRNSVKSAKGATVRVARSAVQQPARPAQSALSKYKPIDPLKNARTIIALGASTGGTEALQEVVKEFPKDTPGVVIVQHMPAGFTKMYAERLNKICKMDVKEAADGDRVRKGLIILGAGNFHLTLKRDASGYYVSSKKGEKVSGHCPSVDVLFESVAEVGGANAVGAILTGMGADGAKGLLQMRRAGAYTIGQDKETCVVYGMPMVAYNNGAVIRQAPLNDIAGIILSRMK
jgi:two-component system chemotaxis response regulator CheB